MLFKAFFILFGLTADKTKNREIKSNWISCDKCLRIPFSSVMSATNGVHLLSLKSGFARSKSIATGEKSHTYRRKDVFSLMRGQMVFPTPQPTSNNK